MKTMILGLAAAAMTFAAGAAAAQPYGYYDGQRGYYDRGYDGYGRHQRGYRDSDRDGTPDRREWNRDKDCDGRPDQYDRRDDNRRRCYTSYGRYNRWDGGHYGYRYDHRRY